LEDERDKSRSSDAFCFDSRPEGIKDIRGPDITDTNWFGVDCVAGPWRMTVNNPSIILRQSRPRNEPHHPRLIKEEDGGTFTTQGAADRVQSCIVDVCQRGGTEEPICELIQRCLLISVP